ncbi:unnamed protein product [Polarella glacialis]|uniref:Uncharacterized protein n=1 Tax=Polarella glacialis TaxID=89957 RepID=A0A813K887_POLGL|nr:unnamed protein product [Polarella glacialis]
MQQNVFGCNSNASMDETLSVASGSSPFSYLRPVTADQYKVERPHRPKGRRGRPRSTWADSMFKEAVATSGAVVALRNLWRSTPEAKSAWQALVHQRCGG